MKKRVFIIIIITLLLFSSLIMFSFADYNVNVLKKYENMTGEQIIANLQNLEKKSMVEEIKKVYSVLSDGNTSALIPFAVALDSRINEYSDNEVINLILDDNNNLHFRIDVVQIYGMGFNDKTTKGNESIRELIFDDQIDNCLKRNIILSFDFSDVKGIEMLNSVANGKDDMLAYRAIRKLDTLDSNNAREISNQILKNYKNETPEKINAALNTKAMEFKNYRVQKSFTVEKQQQKKEFIEICNNIINTSDNNELIHCAVYALSNMTDSDAIAAIIKNKNIDGSLKGYTIRHNYSTLMEMAKSENNVQYVDIICDAMKIYPIKGLNQPLTELKAKILSKQIDSFTTDESIEVLIKRIDEVNKLIENQGVKPNPN